MASFILIESRDPLTDSDCQFSYSLAGDLADAGDDVTVYLVQNGVIPARSGSKPAAELSALAAKATVVADDFSLRERGIGGSELLEGVAVSNVDDLVDRMVEPDTKVIWH